MSKEEKKFYEEREVKEIKESGRKTPMGEPILDVEFTDGTKKTMTSMRFQTMTSPEKSDATKAREQLVVEIARKMYAMMIEYGVRVAEIDALINGLVKQINASQEQANCILWKLDHEYDRDLVHINDVLMDKYGESEEPKKD